MGGDGNGAAISEVEVDEVAAAAVASVATAETVEEPPTGRRARRRARGRSSKKGQADLAARSAAEDVWVREDLRRIGVISALLIAGLAVAYVVFGVVDVLGLY
jgi:hypothetical protein